MNNTKQDLLTRTTTILSIIILTLGAIAALSGILIGFYYQPIAGDAYKSLANIDRSIPFGWIVYSLHNYAGNGIIVVSLLQIIVMFFSRQFRRSWFVAWVSGILLTISAIGLGWTAMILNWNQLGYWRLKVELGIVNSLPVAGETIGNLLTGGGGINTDTVVHFYAIHSYILSVAAIALAVIHLVALVIRERERESIFKQLEKLIDSTSRSKQAKDPTKV